ncbi:MAG TPA: hypothetical protein VLG92_05175 [Candidatus Saccharimonadia bacterium]|nr:hypothetical protein [Candidatus Saccharimonadia bacterium]
MVNLVAMLLFGAFAGWLTAQIMHIKTEFWGNALLGTVGAMIGSAVMILIGGSGVHGFTIYSLLVSTGGACLFTWFVRQITYKGTKRR